MSVKSSPVQRLADFACALRYEDLPQRVRDHAADIVLDMFGVMIWGAQDSFLRRYRKLMLARQPRAGATLLGTEYQAEPSLAALFNAATTTVTQIDEGHRRALGHPGIHIIPAALAIAENEGLSGKDFITALVAAYEVSVRIGRSMRPLLPGIHAHGHWPVIAAAVGGARLLGADRRAMAETIEAAATLTLRPATSTVNHGATVHHLFPGLGAQHAVVIAYGAMAGMTGAPGTLTDFLGPDSAVKFRPELLEEDLAPGAVTYEILNSYFKFQPVCAHAITTVEAIDAMRPKLPAVDQIESVSVRTYGLAAELHNQEPTTSLASKFSIPFVVAARLTGEATGLTSLHDRDLSDPRLRGLMRRVKVTVDPELDAQYPAGRPSVVEITARDGRRFTERRDMPRGDADNPATADELRSKFLELTGPVLGPERAADLAGKLLRISECGNMADLVRSAASTKGG